MPIPVPEGVTVTIKKNKVTVTGPKGELERSFNPDMKITLKDNNLIVSRPDDSKGHRSMHGLTRSLLANMVQGVSGSFEKTLEIVGVGYRAEKKRPISVRSCLKRRSPSPSVFSASGTGSPRACICSMVASRPKTSTPATG